MNLYAVAKVYLENGGFLLCVDTRTEGVQVPEYYLNLDQVYFQFCKNVMPPIKQLRLTSDGAEGVLSFRAALGRDCFCFVPWTAVRAIVPMRFGVPLLALYETPDPVLSAPKGVLQRVS